MSPSLTSPPPDAPAEFQQWFLRELAEDPRVPKGQLLRDQIADLAIRYCEEQGVYVDCESTYSKLWRAVRALRNEGRRERSDHE